MMVSIFCIAASRAVNIERKVKHVLKDTGTTEYCWLLTVTTCKTGVLARGSEHELTIMFSCFVSLAILDQRNVLVVGIIALYFPLNSRHGCLYKRV